MSQSRAFGSHSITLAALPTSEESIDVPLCKSIRTYSCKDGTGSYSTKPTSHQSVITFICASPSGTKYVTCDWGGVIAVHDNNWTLCYSFVGEDPPVAGICFLNDDELLVLNRGKMDFRPGTVSLYELGATGATLVKSLKDDIFKVKCYDNEIYVWKSTPFPTLMRSNDRMSSFSTVQFQDENDFSLGNAMNSNHLVISFRNRNLCILNPTDLEKKESAHLKNISSCQIWRLEFTGPNQLLYQKRLDTYSVMDILTGDILQTFNGPDHFVCYMKLMGSILWIGTVEGVFRLTFADDDFIYHENDKFLTDEPTWLTPEITAFHNHEVSCCGIAISHDGKYVLSGDLGGNIIIWNIEHNSVFAQTKVEDSVRCLVWYEKSGLFYVFFGSLTGSLYLWDTSTSSAVQLLTDLDTVTTLRIQSDVLALGCITGEIFVYNISTDALASGTDVLTPYFHLIAHSPIAPTSSQEASNFGSLRLKAEIWSLVFSPCSQFIATCSEDQTIKIININDHSVVHTFKDHALAVTSVAWVSAGGLSLLVSCSDDCKIVVREMNTLTKLAVLECPEVVGFCTLTYLSVMVPASSETHSLSDDVSALTLNLTASSVEACFADKAGQVKIVCGSENGYLMVRDMVTGGVEYNERVHQGSVEGLCVHEDTIATCSSDCTVQLHSLKGLQG